MNPVEVEAFIAIGSNLGDRSAFVQFAFDSIESLPQTILFARSPVIETAPVGPGLQDSYLNAAAGIRTTLSPQQLLACLLDIERAAGRSRSSEQRWGPRVLDLDILLFGNSVIDEPSLSIPHPRMHERRFVLEPLSAIAPDRMHPTSGACVSDLLRDLPEED